ncbi:hypothetical protein V6N11_030723 [Hibiscus sabdariffa]|uniref:F-box domain-containing protein n=1 Tax=Hibiscus sabdariffa TaxID=183260 RepID=A0ABR2NBT2_9ROSI
MSDYMPVEVIIEILKRLPAKPVVRFRSVCKSWDTLIYKLHFPTTPPFSSSWNGKRNGGGYSHAILGFELSAEEFFEINLPENLIDLCHVDLTVMKYGESSIVVSTYQA